MLTSLRRALYRVGVLRARRLPVPVIVVGNISVGGSGKTPLVLWLARLLAAHGFHPGIVSRGYRGSARAPSAVAPQADARVFGDEAVLLARASGAPVWVGRNRARAAQALLAQQPQCDVLLSDDGLQHYALARDIELALLPAAANFGNGWLLPAGPLREPLSRLRRVDALLCHQNSDAYAKLHHRVFALRTEVDRVYQLCAPQQVCALSRFAGQRVHAVAGIRQPQRFFDMLRAHAIEVIEHALGDHEPIAETLLGSLSGTVLITEKDAVKWPAPVSTDVWVVAITLEPDAGFDAFILSRLTHGPKAA